MNDSVSICLSSQQQIRREMRDKILAGTPIVSIIIPCRSEREFISKCLDSIIANDYPADRFEILVVDGMSEDGTRAVLGEYVQEYPYIRILNNPRKITPSALNTGIKSAKGEIIMRMDAHATYDREYISRCVKALHEHDADNVGGIWRIVPRSNTLLGKAIVRSFSHKFGVGNTHYRLANSKEPREVDTVPFFCCKKEVFQKIGLFNERLVRGQDMEFNLRLKKSGRRTLLVPDIVSYYYARSDMKSFLKHNWTNGVWAILPFLYSDIMPVSWRHLVPLAFVLGVLGSAILALVWPVGLWVLFGISGAYVAANLAASAQVALRGRDVRYLFVMLVVFASFHTSYGFGSLWGLVKVLAYMVSKLGCKLVKVKRSC